ncbi:MAG: urease accessory protein [Phreatobacter sp.]|nr:urease accessory protein [Phreatobacter sp.]
MGELATWLGPTTGGFLLLGLLMGMTHALEADHLAAMGTLAAQGKGRLALRGMAWGIGHTIMLFAMSVAVLVFSFALTEARAAMLEFAVGVMLVGLGMDVLRRMYRKQVHFHLHRHQDGKPHLHAHAHPEAPEQQRDAHHHAHPTGFPWRALLVGLVHGAAGSAGLIALAAATTGSVTLVLSYILCFGLGSILGMAALSAVVSLPIARIETFSARLNQWAQIGVAGVAVFIGLSIIRHTLPLAWSLV